MVESNEVAMILENMLKTILTKAAKLEVIKVLSLFLFPHSRVLSRSEKLATLWF